jgi:hypothetical protein
MPDGGTVKERGEDEGTELLWSTTAVKPQSFGLQSLSATFSGFASPLPFDLLLTYLQPWAFSMCCLQLDSRFDQYGHGWK